MNCIHVIGNLGRDPEVKYTQNGKAVCSFSVASSTKFGEKDHTEWFKVVVWGQQAEACGKYLAKGKKAYIQGRLETRTYQDRDGNDKSITELIADRVQFLSPTDDHGGGQGGGGGGQQNRQSGGGQQRQGGQGHGNRQGGQQGGGNRQQGQGQGNRQNQRQGGQQGWDEGGGEWDEGGQGGGGNANPNNAYSWNEDDDIPF